MTRVIASDDPVSTLTNVNLWLLLTILIIVYSLTGRPTGLKVLSHRTGAFRASNPPLWVGDHPPPHIRNSEAHFTFHATI